MVQISDFQKLNISCQNRRWLVSWEKGRYDVQIVTFARLKNAPKIAETITLEIRMGGFEIVGPSRVQPTHPVSIGRPVDRLLHPQRNDGR